MKRCSPLTVSSRTRFNNHSYSLSLPFRRASPLGLTTATPKTATYNIVVANGSDVSLERRYLCGARPVYGLRSHRISSPPSSRLFPIVTSTSVTESSPSSSSSSPIIHQHPMCTITHKPSVIEMLKEKYVIFKVGLLQFKENYDKAKELKWSAKRQGMAITDLPRKDQRLIQLNRSDIKSLIPFVILFLVLPESIPFLLIFYPSLLPSTFQALFSQEKRLIKEALQNEQGILEMHSVATQLEKEKNCTVNELLNSKDYDQINTYLSPNKLTVAMSKYFTIYSKWRPSSLLHSSLSKILTELRHDDKLIMKEGLSSLTKIEIMEAINDRRLNRCAVTSKDGKGEVEGISYDRQVKQLERWLELSQDSKIESTALPFVVMKSSKGN